MQKPKSDFNNPDHLVPTKESAIRKGLTITDLVGNIRTVLYQYLCINHPYILRPEWYTVGESLLKP